MVTFMRHENSLLIKLTQSDNFRKLNIHPKSTTIRISSFEILEGFFSSINFVLNH